MYNCVLYFVTVFGERLIIGSGSGEIGWFFTVLHTILSKFCKFCYSA